ncbi:pentatricopeptide repeat-containing protein at1g60770 [Phtheirospermum japonicum]|uniref:Pentatricopeptide repeat-containing protein at1g60770 n=1 Tax=Phtheirospermum japonicum TaxID=374723 RepID=A0A830BPC4_9LAMI|nr:pentatricopeptide repeat-containing protein at1g60770 [Phtheirospermum japonicum]
MTITRFISRLILQKSSPSFTPRWLCTVTEEPMAAAEAQPKKKTRLFYQVINKANSDKTSVTDVLNNWVNQGNAVRKFDVLNLTKFFRTRKNFHAALKLYDWMEINKFETSNADKAVRIDLLYKIKDISSAEEYFNTLPESEKTSRTYGALLCCYCKEKVFDKAFEIFEKMKASNQITTLNYNNMLLLFYTTEKHENVFSFAQEMEDNKIELDLYTYNLLINSYAALNDLDAVEKVLEKMKSNNVEPDLFTYGNLATVYLNAGLTEKSNVFLEMMEKMEARTDKKVFEACRTRIKLYSEMNNLAGVHRAWETLKSAFPSPNNTSYLFMLLALSKLGDQESLERIFKEWDENCTIYDFRVPNVVLEYYLSRGMIEKAGLLYDGSVNRGAKPNLRTLNLFVNLNLQNGDIDSAMKYLDIGLDRAKSWNSKWFPRDETVKMFVKYFEENEDPERADKFFQRMKGLKRVDDDSMVVNTAEASNAEN